jgi:hypothetical protein
MKNVIVGVQSVKVLPCWHQATVCYGTIVETA